MKRRKDLQKADSLPRLGGAENVPVLGKPSGELEGPNAAGWRPLHAAPITTTSGLGCRGAVARATTRKLGSGYL
jgi:hypothetical protein